MSNVPQTQPVQPAPPLLIIPADNISARPISSTQAELVLRNAAVTAAITVDKATLTQLSSQLGMLASGLEGTVGGLIKPITGLITP